MKTRLSRQDREIREACLIAERLHAARLRHVRDARREAARRADREAAQHAALTVPARQAWVAMNSRRLPDLPRLRPWFAPETE
jgi:hypothetical protein